MSWVRLDDGIFNNPKIALLSDAAQLAHVKAIVYCSQGMTDGDVPMRIAKDLASSKVIKELVPHLWEPTPTGFRVHDYLEYNPSRAQILTRRASDSKRKGGGFRADSVRPDPQPLPDPVDPLPDPIPDPTRPRSDARVEWENRIGFLSSADSSEFKEYEDIVPEGWFMDAIDLTVEKADRPSWAFCRSVLKRCLETQEPPRARKGKPAQEKPQSVADVLARKKVGAR